MRRTLNLHATLELPLFKICHSGFDLVEVREPMYRAMNAAPDVQEM